MGSFLRAFTFGHVRQLDAVASRFLTGLTKRTGLLGSQPEAADTARADGYALVDVDDTIIEVHGHTKQGTGFGYSGVRGLNALLATLTTAGTAPVIVAQRLRKGSCGSPRGAKRLVADAVKQANRLLPAGTPVLVRMDSAFYGRAAVHAALAGGADVSVTVRMDKAVKAAIAAISDDAWTAIEYPDAIFDQATGAWVSRAEVAEVDFTAFAAQAKREHVPGRLVVRRIPDVNAERNKAAGQGTLFDAWRFHAFFTTAPTDVLDTVAADKTHRDHAIIEQVHADLKGCALAHLPSGKFTAYAAWLVLAVIAFNLTRAGAVLTVAPTDTPPGLGPEQSYPGHHPAQTDPRPGPGRDLRPPSHPAPARRLALERRMDSPVRASERPPSRDPVLTTQPHGATEESSVEHARQQGRAFTHVLTLATAPKNETARARQSIGGSRLSNESCCGTG